MVVYERFIYPKKDSSWTCELLYWCALAAIFCGMRFGPVALMRPLRVCLMVVWGISAFAGDRWGLTKSRYLSARLLGWTIMLTWAGVMFLGAYYLAIGDRHE